MDNRVGWFASVFEFLCPRADSTGARQAGQTVADYLAIDVETTGLDVRSDLITQVGWARVQGAEVVSHGEITLDWTRPHLEVDRAWLAGRLEEIRLKFARKGLAGHVSPESMATGGVDPLEALETYRAIISDALADGAWIAGHNAWAFDRPLIANQLRAWDVGPVRFPHDRFIDTFLIEKSRLLRLVPPAPGSDAPCRWYDRLARDGRQVRCGLDSCAKTYDLGADPALAHTAGHDCLQVVKLVTKMRQLAQRGPLGPTQADGRPDSPPRDCPPAVPG